MLARDHAQMVRLVDHQRHVHAPVVAHIVSVDPLQPPVAAVFDDVAAHDAVDADGAMAIREFCRGGALVRTAAALVVVNKNTRGALFYLACAQVAGWPASLLSSASSRGGVSMRRQSRMAAS